jgi:hypothetical protein
VTDRDVIDAYAEAYANLQILQLRRLGLLPPSDDEEDTPVGVEPSAEW